MPLTPTECIECEEPIAQAQLILGEGAFAGAWAKGRAMAPVDVIAYALERELGAIAVPSSL